MKYYVALLIILMWGAYKLAHYNDEALSEADSYIEQDGFHENENKMAKIDLRKITLPKRTSQNHLDTQEVSAVDDTDEIHAITRNTDVYVEDYGAGSSELHETKFSENSEQKYRQDVNPEETSKLIDSIKDKIK